MLRHTLILAIALVANAKSIVPEDLDPATTDRKCRECVTAEEELVTQFKEEESRGTTMEEKEAEVDHAAGVYERAVTDHQQTSTNTSNWKAKTEEHIDACKTALDANNPNGILELTGSTDVDGLSARANNWMIAMGLNKTAHGVEEGAKEELKVARGAYNASKTRYEDQQEVVRKQTEVKDRECAEMRGEQEEAAPEESPEEAAPEESPEEATPEESLA